MSPWRYSAIMVLFMVATATVCVLQLKAQYHLLPQKGALPGNKADIRVFTGAELEELLGPGKSAGQPEQKRIERERIFIKPSKVNLSLTTFPSGAYIIIDRHGRGRSPLSLKGLKPGRHLVEISKPGYILQRMPVDMVTDQRLSIKLRKGRGPRIIQIAQERETISSPQQKAHRSPQKRSRADTRCMAGLMRDPLGTERIRGVNESFY